MPNDALPSIVSRVRTRVLGAIRTHDLLPPGGWVVVGVSGGADSLCLLHVLAQLHTRLKLGGIIAATFDHGLRGQEGADDAAFVVETATAWGIPVHAGRAHRLGGDEASARQARYEFLMNVCAATGADRLAVGHHADDQAETVLLRLLRGAGADGLAGMAYRGRAPFPPHLPLIRPLLDVRRAETEAYCAALGIVPRHDATNDDTGYLRNRVRLQVLPALRAVSPQIDVLLGQTGEAAAADADFLRGALAARTQSAQLSTADAITLPRCTFHDLPPALARRWVLDAGRQLAPGITISYRRIMAAVTVGRGGAGKIALLGGGLRLCVLAAYVQVERVRSPVNTDL